MFWMFALMVMGWWDETTAVLHIVISTVVNYMTLKQSANYNKNFKCSVNVHEKSFLLEDTVSSGWMCILYVTEFNTCIAFGYKTQRLYSHPRVRVIVQCCLRIIVEAWRGIIQVVGDVWILRAWRKYIHIYAL